MVPVALQRAAKQFRDALEREEHVFVEADADADGIASAVLLRAALGDQVDGAETVMREWVHPTDIPLLLADLALFPNTPAERAVRGSPRAYAVDHHPWQDVRVDAALNPYLLGLPQIWNTGVLVYITFQDRLRELSWLAAASAVADHTWGEHMEELFGPLRPEYERVAHILGSLPLHPDVDVRRIPEMLGIPTSLHEFLDNSQLLHIRSDVERELARYTEHPEDIALVFDPRRRIMVIYIDSRFRGLKSVVSTILSEKYPNWLICTMQKYGNALHVSLRLAKSKDYGIDLGRIAYRIARELMGMGGGHPEAAGMTLPPSILPDDVVNALYREVRRLGSP